MSRGQRVRPGLRRDVAILLPVALVLLVLLSTFTLFSYRGALSRLLEEARHDALTVAVRLASAVGDDRLPPLDDLQRLSPRIVRIALLDAEGGAIFETGQQTGADLLAGFTPDDLERPTARGPGTDDGWITAVAPASRDGRRHYVRVDLDTSTLAGRIRGIAILTWVVLVVNGGLGILVLLFLRHLLTPIDQMVERARRLLPQSGAAEDEMTLLVSSFERAAEALAHDLSGHGDEIEALERTLGPNLESGMLLVDTRKNALALNRAGAAILGIDVPKAPAPLRELLGTPGRALCAVIDDAVSGDHVVQRHETGFDRDGEELTLGLSVNPLRRDDGSTRAFLVLFADLTETSRQAREERVATTLAQIGELAAGVAHEMRNSLATFRGYLTLVERSPDEESIADYLGELRRETDHLQRVLDDFLSFARPESTRLEDTDVAVVMRRAASDPALETTSIQMSLVPAAIRGDAQLLERAFRNLLHNAAEASAESQTPSPVEVGMALLANRVLVTIADRGVGIPDEIRESLFQPFVTGRGSGTGLGLALAHRIIHLHDGRLSLEDRPGGGTVARLELPLASRPATSS
jgi:signal transduction histidine kinase